MMVLNRCKPLRMPDRKLRNVILLGIAFMLMYAAVTTVDIIQSTMTESIHMEDPSFQANAYTSLAISFSCISVSCWLAPSIVHYLTPKWAMVAAALPTISNTIPLMAPSTPLLYSLSALSGFGDGIVWTGQGSFMTMNSDSKNHVRDWGIFWTLYQSSLLAGNSFVYFEFQGQTHIFKTTRTIVLGSLLAVGATGVLVLCLLRPSAESLEDQDEHHVSNAVEMTTPGAAAAAPAESDGPSCRSEGAGKCSGQCQALVLASARLLFTPKMALLCVMFLYLGVHLSFFTGVYGGAVGFTEQFGPDRTKFVGISGLLVGVGEITGGLLFGILANKKRILGRASAVVLGGLCHLTAFALAFLNLPDNSVFGTTGDSAFIHSQMWLAMLCSFLLGFGDATIQTQANATVSSMYPDDSGPAFALLTFSQCLAAALAFLYSTVLGLYMQLLVLSIACIAGTTAFCVVCRKCRNSRNPTNSQ